MVEEALEVVKGPMLGVVHNEGGLATEAETRGFGGGGCVGRRRASRTGVVGHEDSRREEERGDKSDPSGSSVLVKVSHTLSAHRHSIF